MTTLLQYGQATAPLPRVNEYEQICITCGKGCKRTHWAASGDAQPVGYADAQRRNPRLLQPAVTGTYLYRARMGIGVLS
jgi:hypothetical protein